MTEIARTATAEVDAAKAAELRHQIATIAAHFRRHARQGTKAPTTRTMEFAFETNGRHSDAVAGILMRRPRRDAARDRPQCRSCGRRRLRRDPRHAQAQAQRRLPGRPPDLDRPCPPRARTLGQAHAARRPRPGRGCGLGRLDRAHRPRGRARHPGRRRVRAGRARRRGAGGGESPAATRRGPQHRGPRHRADGRRHADPRARRRADHRPRPRRGGNAAAQARRGRAAAGRARRPVRGSGRPRRPVRRAARTRARARPGRATRARFCRRERLEPLGLRREEPPRHAGPPRGARGAPQGEAQDAALLGHRPRGARGGRGVDAVPPGGRHAPLRRRHRRRRARPEHQAREPPAHRADVIARSLRALHAAMHGRRPIQPQIDQPPSPSHRPPPRWT